MLKRLFLILFLAAIGLTNFAQTVRYGAVNNAAQISSSGLIVADETASKIPTASVFGNQQIIEAPASPVVTSSANASEIATSGTKPVQAPQRKASNNTTAPMPMSGLTADFPNGSLTGTVSFTMPTKQVDGKNISANTNLTYHVTVDGVEYSGGSKRGNFVSLEVTVAQAKTISIVAYVFNGTNKQYSDNVTISVAVGEFTPTTVTTPLLRSVDGGLELTWELVSPAGYYDPEKVAYRITRLVDNVVVADSIKENTFIDHITETELTGYSYQVNVIYNHQLQNRGMKSNRIAYGNPKDLPYTSPMSAEDFNLWSTPNVNSWKRQSPPTYSSYFCSYAHDFLFSPPFEFKKGLYKVTIEAGGTTASGSNPELLMVDAYYSNVVSTDNLVTKLDFQRLGGYHKKYGNNYSTTQVTYINITEDQQGYIAFEGNNKYFYFFEFKVESLPSQEVPGPVSDIVAEPTEVGASDCRISFVTPTTNMLGQTIDALEKVEVFRNDTTLIATIENPRTGAEYSCIDNTPESGYNPYKIVAYNEAGAGVSATIEGYVGLDRPCDVDSMWIKIENGAWHLQWTPVTQGVHGKPIGHVTYTIIDSNGYVYAEDVDDTQVTLPLTVDGPQTQFATLYVAAKNNPGTFSPNFISNAYRPVIGYAEPLTPNHDYYEHFDGYDNHTLVNWLGVQGGYGWEQVDEAFEGQSPLLGAFDEPGFIRTQGIASMSGMLCTQNYNLTELQNPTLEFYACANGSSEIVDAEIKVWMIKDYSGERVLLQSPISSEQLGDRKWHVFKYPLPDAKGCDVVRFEFEVDGSDYVCLDDIHLWDKYETDLDCRIKYAPTELRVGQTEDITVVVSNFGDETIKSGKYDVRVYRDDSYQLSLPSVELAPYESHTYTISATGQLTDNEVKYRFVVDGVNGEGNLANNQSAVTIAIIQPNTPAPLNLTGIENNGMAELNWNIPDGEGTYDKTLVQGAEEYGDYDLGGISASQSEGHFGDWTVFNGNTTDIEKWAPNGLVVASWMVVNPEVLTSYYQSRFTPHSGDKAFFSPRAGYDFINDDMCNTNNWLVTPRLNGKAQTIKFWYKRTTDSGSDVLYIGCATDEELTPGTNFTVNGQANVRNNEWQQGYLEIPEGTTYVAFVHQSWDGTTNGQGIMLDDIEFTVEADASELEVMDYTVYRDNKVIATGVTDTHYVDAVPKPGVYRYRVSANYAEAGESALSNEVELFIINTPGPDDPVTSLDDLTADGTIVVRPVEGGVQVRNASGEVLSVYNVAGQLMGRVVAHSDLETIALSPGMYLVTAGNKVGKVLVR